MSKVGPIPFTGPMVVAVGEDRKTMTRRLIKPQPSILDRKSSIYSPYYTMDDGTLVYSSAGALGEHREPQYQVGRTYYVRETWRVTAAYDETNVMLIQLRADAAVVVAVFAPARYAQFKKFANKPGWQSPYFFPCEAARYWVTITAVRAERLQDISVEDVWREGIDVGDVDNEDVHKLVAGVPNWNKLTEEQREACFESWARSHYIKCCDKAQEAIRAFKSLWNSINAKRGHGWEKNDWVFAYTFKRVGRPETGEDSDERHEN